MNKQIAQKPKFSVAIRTDGYKNLINNTLGDPERAKRFVAAISSAVATNQALQECDAGTILSGGLLGESLNLSPSPQLGQYYLVPFNDKKSGGKKAQFILGYKGYIQLALRSGQYSDLDVMEIREGEYLGKDCTTGKPKFKFIEDDEIRENLPVIGYMAFFEYLNGFKKVLYWSKQKVIIHADKYSPAFSAKTYEKYIAGEIPNNELWKYSSHWYQNFDDMAKKTMLRQLISRWGVMSTQMQTALETDSNVVTLDENNEIVTTPENMLEENAEEIKPDFEGVEDEEVNLNNI